MKERDREREGGGGGLLIARVFPLLIEKPLQQHVLLIKTLMEFDIRNVCKSDIAEREGGESEREREIKKERNIYRKRKRRERERESER